MARIPHLALVAAITLGCALPAIAEDDDVVVFKNGDRLTGEIKKLERGRLRFKSDAVGTIDIAWIDIARIVSDRVFDLEVLSGEDYFGTIGEPVRDDTLRVVSEDETEEDLESESVVRITPIESTWLSRVDGSVSVGYTYTQASAATQLSFDSTFSQTTRRHSRLLTLTTIATDQEGVDRTDRWDIGFSNERDLGGLWFFESLGSYARNEELGLEARLLAGAGGGKRLIQRPNASFSVMGGLAASREDASGTATAETNLEGLVMLRGDRFWVHDPEIDVTFSLGILPGLSPSGRLRAEFDARIRREIVSDLFLNLTVFNSYDSDPPTAGAEKNDFGIVTSVGWSF